MAIAARVSTDSDASARLRHSLADKQPTQVGQPIVLADDESTQPLRRPQLR